jgi:hypothetical protein
MILKIHTRYLLTFKQHQFALQSKSLQIGYSTCSDQRGHLSKTDFSHTLQEGTAWHKNNWNFPHPPYPKSRLA